MKFKFSNTKNRFINKGFSLLETVIYIALMTVILASLIFLIDSAIHTYSLLKSTRNLERTAINIMNGIGESASVATKIEMSETIFNNDIGAIALTEFNEAGTLSTTTKFYLENGRVLMAQNGLILGPVSLSDSNVTKLLFKNMSTSTINGFKVELVVDNASSSVEYFSKSFYNSYILR